MGAPSPDLTLGYLVLDVARLMSASFEARTRSIGVTRAQWSLIAALVRNEGCNQAQLAELMQITPISLGRLVDRMVKAGWVERRAEAGDRRSHRLFLTANGHAIRPALRELSDQTQDEPETAEPAEATADDEGPTLLVPPPPPEPEPPHLPQAWVLELSSFQLDGTAGGAWDQVPTASTVLNITEDHIDWHGSMAAYAQAKAAVTALWGAGITTSKRSPGSCRRIVAARFWPMRRRAR